MWALIARVNQHCYIPTGLPHTHYEEQLCSCAKQLAMKLATFYQIVAERKRKRQTSERTAEPDKDRAVRLKPLSHSQGSTGGQTGQDA